MFGSVILEVAMGIIFIFILLSTIATTLREGIEGWLKSRAAYLEFGIRELLHDRKAEGIVKSFYSHPLINGLFSADYTPKDKAKPLSILASGGKLPSYIPSKNFALALMDIAARGPDTDVVNSDPNAPVISLATIRMNVLNVGNKAVQRLILTAIDTAQGDLNQAQANIEDWYNSSMDRVSGWYKRSTYWILFWIGLFLAVGLNINTITIADYLYRHDDARGALVKRAEALASDTSQSIKYEAAKAQLDSLSLPVGWDHGWGSPIAGMKGFDWWNDVFAMILGWLITAFAVTLGAPFWFDMLNKIMVIRTTVKPHEKSQEEASEDRQLPQNRTPAPVMQEQAPAKPPGAAQVPALPLNAVENVQNNRDSESDIDGCEVVVNDVTPDEDLPASEGGVI